MWVTIGLFVVCALLGMPGRRRRRGEMQPLLWKTGSHWRRNYGRRAFLRLGATVAGAGLLAYSGADEALDGLHADQVRSPATDRFAHLVNPWGERWWFLNWFLVAAVDAWFRTGPFSRWGRANFEALVVGLPTLWTVQRGLGSNRPSDPDPDPRWRPLADDNAASGHAFISAVPWLNLARRIRPRGLRWPARLGSFLTGWSRINDRKHYPSQVALGWVIAWNAVEAVRPEDDDGVSPSGAKGRP